MDVVLPLPGTSILYPTAAGIGKVCTCMCMVRRPRLPTPCSRASMQGAAVRQGRRAFCRNLLPHPGRPGPRGPCPDKRSFGSWQRRQRRSCPRRQAHSDTQMLRCVRVVVQAEYAALMKEDGLDIDQMETKAKEFTLAGFAWPPCRVTWPAATHFLLAPSSWRPPHARACVRVCMHARMGARADTRMHAHQNKRARTRTHAHRGLSSDDGVCRRYALGAGCLQRPLR